jgi:hypothetical protein
LPSSTSPPCDVGRHPDARQTEGVGERLEARRDGLGPDPVCDQCGEWTFITASDRAVWRRMTPGCGAKPKSNKDRRRSRLVSLDDTAEIPTPRRRAIVHTNDDGAHCQSCWCESSHARMLRRLPGVLGFENRAIRRGPDGRAVRAQTGYVEHCCCSRHARVDCSATKGERWTTGYSTPVRTQGGRRTEGRTAATASKRPATRRLRWELSRPRGPYEDAQPRSPCRPRPSLRGDQHGLRIARPSHRRHQPARP